MRTTFSTYDVPVLSRTIRSGQSRARRRSSDPTLHLLAWTRISVSQLSTGIRRVSRDVTSRERVLTIVRSADARMWSSFKYETKKDTFDGFPGGCVKAGLVVVAAQYSSSHSTGKSRSKLISRWCHDCFPMRFRNELTLRLAPRMGAQGQNCRTYRVRRVSCEVGSIVTLTENPRRRLTRRLASRAHLPLLESSRTLSFYECQLLVKV